MMYQTVLQKPFYLRRHIASFLFAALMIGCGAVEETAGTKPGDVIQPGPVATPQDPVPDGTPVPGPIDEVPTAGSSFQVLDVKSSNSDRSYTAELTVDGNAAEDSRWSALPENDVFPWVQYEVSDGAEIRGIGIYFLLSDSRSTHFDVLTSPDEVTWDLAFSGESSGSSPLGEAEVFPLDALGVRYIRIIGYGNSQEGSDWTSIQEVEFYGADTMPANDGSEVQEVLRFEVPVTNAAVAVEAFGSLSVSNRTELEAALSEASGGDVITLRDGDYGDFDITDLGFNDYVILRAETTYGAAFNDVTNSGKHYSAYLHFDQVRINRIGGSDRIRDINDLKFTNSRITGQATFRAVDKLVFTGNNMDVFGRYNALTLSSVSNFEVRENYISRAQEDLMRLIGDSYNGLIENNVFYDTLPRNIPRDDNPCAYNHTDGLQMFGLNGANPRDIEIRGNYFYDNPLNNDIRPSNCVSAHRENVRLTMQGIFMSDPSGGGYENMIVEDNLIYVGTPNSVYINGATSNVSVRNNTLLPWKNGGGGSIRVVQRREQDNRGLIVENNVVATISDQTKHSVIRNNFQYSRTPGEPHYLGSLMQAKGAGSRWQHFVPEPGTDIELDGNYGAVKRLRGILDKQEDIPRRGE